MGPKRKEESNQARKELSLNPSVKSPLAMAMTEEEYEGLVLLPGLPNEVALQCIIRVARRCHAALRCVCRAWRNLLASPSFYHMRQTQGLMAEEWLYVMLRTHWGEYRWLSFEEGGGGVRRWRPLPPMPLHSIGAACASLGSKIYLIGGSHGGSASRSVCRYDSRTNRWEMAAHLRVPREFAAAGSVDGLLYVVGGCSPVAGSLAWAEVYDPLADKWSVVPSPVERRERWMHGYATLDKKLFAVADTGGVVFDPASASWNAISAALDRGWRGRAAVVKGILFSPDYLGKIMGYDLAKDDWQELEGVQLGLPKLTSIVTLCAVSDKLYVLGERPLRGRESELAVAAVEVEKGPNRLEGRVLWSHVSPCNMSVAAIIHCLPVRL